MKNKETFEPILLVGRNLIKDVLAGTILYTQEVEKLSWLL